MTAGNRVRKHNRKPHLSLNSETQEGLTNPSST